MWVDKNMEKEYSTSITQIDNCLIVSLASEMNDESMDDILRNATTKAYHTRIRGAVLDFTLVSVVDTFAFHSFIKISRALLLMDVKVVWAGLRPGVVYAMMDLDMDLGDEKILTALSLEHALTLLSGAKSK